MIDRGLDDNCGPILACYIGPKIAPDDRPRITARIFQIYDDINNDNKFGVKFTGDYRSIAIIPTLFREHRQKSKKPNFSSFFRLLTVIPE